MDANIVIIDKSIDLFALVDGFRYISAASRRIFFDPAIKDLEDHLDDWGQEESAILYLQRLGTNIPEDLIWRYVRALTATYVGYKGSSYHYGRTNFYSNAAAPRITQMFEKFDNTSAMAFTESIKTDERLQGRIKSVGQLNRLRTLAEILLNKTEIRSDIRAFLEVLADKSKTNEFFASIR